MFISTKNLAIFFILRQSLWHMDPKDNIKSPLLEVFRQKCELYTLPFSTITAMKWRFRYKLALQVYEKKKQTNCVNILDSKVPMTKAVAWYRKKIYPMQRRDIVIPREKGILFSVCLSVCLSVRLSVCPGLSFFHFVRVTPPTVFITHKPNLYHLKAGCLECVMLGSVFSYPPKFRRNRPLKTAQNHKF